LAKNLEVKHKSGSLTSRQLLRRQRALSRFLPSRNLLLIAAKKGNAMQDSTQVDYKILSRTKASFLEEDIAEWTADGYRLVGGMCVSTRKTGQTVFYQAVARKGPR
jgi:hypothetical protein